ncbi:hypothetical protein SynBIOSE41_02392 [Synechococcus sp. BIOS-E4-1]|nr:hypothetical protein SynBIOSE41_02392 [Synechococcus sp. BIOS-E4-1]
MKRGVLTSNSIYARNCLLCNVVKTDKLEGINGFDFAIN